MTSQPDAQEQHLGRKVGTENFCQTKLTKMLVLASVIYAWSLLTIGPAITIMGALKIKIFKKLKTLTEGVSMV